MCHINKAVVSWVIFAFFFTFPSPYPHKVPPWPCWTWTCPAPANSADSEPPGLDLRCWSLSLWTCIIIIINNNNPHARAHTSTHTIWIDYKFHVEWRSFTPFSWTNKESLLGCCIITLSLLGKQFQQMTFWKKKSYFFLKIGINISCKLSS